MRIELPVLKSSLCGISAADPSVLSRVAVSGEGEGSSHSTGVVCLLSTVATQAFQSDSEPVLVKECPETSP